MSGYAELSEVVARSEKRAKIRKINRPYDSIVAHPTIFGLVNAPTNGMLRLTNAQIAELQQKEAEDEARIEEARKVVDEYEKIKTLLTRRKGKENGAYVEQARASAELLEWTATHATAVLDQNKL